MLCAPLLFPETISLVDHLGNHLLLDHSPNEAYWGMTQRALPKSWAPCGIGDWCGFF